jgi:ATP-dependent DNA ligase
VAASSALGARQDAACRSSATRQSFRVALVLSKVHWVRPEMVVEVSYVERTPDGLLRHVVYLGEREDKPAIDVRRDPPHAG